MFLNIATPFSPPIFTVFATKVDVFKFVIVTSFDVFVDELILFDTFKLPDMTIPLSVTIEDVA